MTFEYYYLIQDLTGVITVFFSLRFILLLIRFPFMKRRLKCRVLLFQTLTFAIGMMMLCMSFSMVLSIVGLGMIMYLKHVSKFALRDAMLHPRNTI